MTHVIRSAAIAAFAVAALFASAAAQDFRSARVETVPVSDNVYMLIGRGGNIGVSIGEDGVFMIDDQFAPLTGKIMEAVEGLTDKPVRFLVNTHWHGDHTGGNENLGGAGAIIVAHENVRERMSTEQFMKAFNRTVPPAPDAALPVVTFGDGLTFHWNGDDIRVKHVPHAHTDGDAIIHFRKANVIHAGDTFFAGSYPFIDYGSGGTIEGVIKTADEVLAMANAETKIIPGHGPLADASSLREYRDMLATIHGRLRELADQGKTLDEIVAAAPTRDYDEKWGTGFLGPEQWLGIVYAGMTE